MPRPAGAVNKVSKEAGQLILAVFHNLGGVEAMTEWAQQNKDVFYVHIFPKILRGNTLALFGDAPVGQSVVLNVTNVQDPSGALTALEKLEDARVAHRASGRNGDEPPLVVPLPAHASGVSSPDGGDIGFAPAQSDSDAAATWEDSDMRAGASVPLSVDVPESVSDLRGAQC